MSLSSQAYAVVQNIHATYVIDFLHQVSIVRHVTV